MEENFQTTTTKKSYNDDTMGLAIKNNNKDLHKRFLAKQVNNNNQKVDSDCEAKIRIEK